MKHEVKRENRPPRRPDGQSLKWDAELLLGELDLTAAFISP
jgi:hypothetical protein